jgi:hypothetical protein
MGNVRTPDRSESDSARFFVTGAAEARAGGIGHYQIGLAVDAGRARAARPCSVEVRLAVAGAAAPPLAAALESAAEGVAPAIAVRGDGAGARVTFAPGAPPLLAFSLAIPEGATSMRLDLAAADAGAHVEPEAAAAVTRVIGAPSEARWWIAGALDAGAGGLDRCTIGHDGPGAAPGAAIGVGLRLGLPRAAHDLAAAAAAAVAHDIAAAVAGLGPGAAVSAEGARLIFAAGAPRSLDVTLRHLARALGAGDTAFTLALEGARGASSVIPARGIVSGIAGEPGAAPRWRLTRERGGRGGRATYLVDYAGPALKPGEKAMVVLRPRPETPAVRAALAADLDAALAGRRGVSRQGLKLVLDHAALPTILLLLLPALEAAARAEGRHLTLDLADPAPGTVAPGAASVVVEPVAVGVIVDGDAEPAPFAASIAAESAWAEDGAHVHSRDADPRLGAVALAGGGRGLSLDYAALIDLSAGAETLRIGGDKGDRLDADLSGHAVRIEDHGSFTRYIVDGGAHRLEVDNAIEQAIRAHFEH